VKVLKWSKLGFGDDPNGFGFIYGGQGDGCMHKQG
jgi:hypothetical protein